MKTLIKAPIGLFFCEAHLEDLPVAQQSYDPRYCHDCCHLLEYEVSLLSVSRWGDPPWAPRKTSPNQNPDKKNHAVVDYHTHVDGKPKQLTLFSSDGNNLLNVHCATLETKKA